MGDKLYVLIDGEVVIMESTNPMMSLSKCKLLPAYAKYFSRLMKDMPVYKYYAGVEKKEAAVQAAVEEPRKAVEEKNFSGIEMVYIPAGSFMMGAVDGDTKAKGDEKPRHTLTIDGFYMGKYNITQAQYEAVMGINPSKFSDNPNNPVEQVSWYDAVEFCNKLSEKAGLTAYYTITKPNFLGFGKDPNNLGNIDKIKWTVTMQTGANGFRLPSEAEWEYAHRAGTAGIYYWGDSMNGEYAWYSGNSEYKTHPVGTKKPNAFGLYDMSGNLKQWCWDWYDETYFPTSPVSNPKGAAAGKCRVLRGGDWYSYGDELRASVRRDNYPDFSYYSIGFRVVSGTR